LKDYTFLKFSIPFILGIICDKFFQSSLIVYLIIIISFSLTFYILNIFIKKKQLTIFQIISIYGIIFFTGAFIANIATEKLQSPLLKYQKEKDAKLFAKVENVQLEKSYEIVFNVIIDSLSFDNKLFITSDKLICKFRGDSAQRKSLYNIIKPGNKIFLTGTYQKGRERRNPGELDYNEYLRSKGIVGLFISYDSDSISIYDNSENVFETSLFTIRKSIDKIIHDLHQPQTAGLLRGLLLADRSEIDYETKNDFINSGVIHILAVSGLHVDYK
jgi:competence protein ComEC